MSKIKEYQKNNNKQLNDLKKEIEESKVEQAKKIKELLIELNKEVVEIKDNKKRITNVLKRKNIFLGIKKFFQRIIN